MTNAVEPTHLTTPLTDEAVGGLKAGDPVVISGVLYTARDAAHERLARMLERGEPLPVDLRGQVIYYCGPTPPRPGRPIGSAGPTTATRMDVFTPALLGQRVQSAEVIAFPDLGPEAIYRFVVDRFPVVVANDVYGNDVYELGRRQYARA